MFETPRPLSNIESDRVSAKLVDGDLHRRASAKRRIEKHKRHALAFKRALAVIAGFDLRRKIDERRQLIRREVRGAEKVFSFKVHPFSVWRVEDHVGGSLRLCAKLVLEGGVRAETQRSAKTPRPSLSQSYSAQLIQKQIDLCALQSQRRQQPQNTR